MISERRNPSSLMTRPLNAVRHLDAYIRIRALPLTFPPQTCLWNTPQPYQTYLFRDQRQFLWCPVMLQLKCSRSFCNNFLGTHLDRIPDYSPSKGQPYWTKRIRVRSIVSTTRTFNSQPPRENMGTRSPLGPKRRKGMPFGSYSSFTTCDIKLKGGLLTRWCVERREGRKLFWVVGHVWPLYYDVSESSRGSSGRTARRTYTYLELEVDNCLMSTILGSIVIEPTRTTWKWSLQSYTRQRTAMALLRFGAWYHKPGCVRYELEVSTGRAGVPERQEWELRVAVIIGMNLKRPGQSPTINSCQAFDASWTKTVVYYELSKR